MRWLMRALGLAKRRDDHLERAMDTATASDNAAARARAAVDSYWRARRAADKAGDALAIDEYSRADAERRQ